MKKIILSILCCLILLTGCNQTTKQVNSTDNTTPTVSQQDKYSIKDFLPNKLDVKYEYKGTGSEYADMTVFTDYIKGNKIQQRISNGGTVVARVIEVQKDSIVQIGTLEEAYYKQDLTSMKNTKPEIILKAPIEKGTSWTLPNGSKRYISNINLDVSTPAGNFKAIEVTTEEKDGKTINYYAPNVGLIKQTFKSNSLNVESVLQSVKENTKYTQNLKVYYPDPINGHLVYIHKDIKLSTNENIQNVLTDILKKSPGKDIMTVFSKDVVINKLYVDIKNHNVYIDLSKNFVDNMNSGAELEDDILQSLANTLGAYYNSNKVFITLDGNKYTSGHIELNKDEPLTVDESNSVQFKK